MNPSQLEGLVRTLGAIVGTYIVAKGWLPAGVWNDLLGVIVFAVSTGWSWKSNSTATMITALTATPEVKQVVLTPEFHNTMSDGGAKAIDAKIVAAPAAPATIWLG